MDFDGLGFRDDYGIHGGVSRLQTNVILLTIKSFEGGPIFVWEPDSDHIAVASFFVDLSSCVFGMWR